MTVTESFEHTQRISPGLEPCGSNLAYFQYPKHFQPEMHVELPKSPWICEVGAKEVCWGWGTGRGVGSKGLGEVWGIGDWERCGG